VYRQECQLENDLIKQVVCKNRIMKPEDKELLKTEILKYVQRENYDRNGVRSISVRYISDVAIVYFAAEDDQMAWTGAQEVMSMFDKDSASYKYEQWDGSWSVDELSAAAEKLFTADEDQYFISWKTGTIGADGGGNGGPGGGASYHMASFDYAYNCVAAMEWLFQQSK